MLIGTLRIDPRTLLAQVGERFELEEPLGRVVLPVNGLIAPLLSQRLTDTATKKVATTAP